MRCTRVRERGLNSRGLAMRCLGHETRRSAFTLIELVTVMVIIGIMAVSVGGPTLAYIGDMRSSAAAARLASDVRYMQRMALGSGLRTWIVVNEPGDSYALYMEDPANPGKIGRVPVVHPLDQTTNAMQFGAGPFAGVSIDQVNLNSTSELEFDNFGVPYDGNGNALTSASQVVLSNNLAVQVHPIGGFVEHISWP